MFAWQIDEVKSFMQKLLIDSVFDSFLFVEGTLHMGIDYTIDGQLNRDFYTEAELSAMPADAMYAPYSQVRPVLFSLIKGKKTPLGFRIILQTSPQTTARILSALPAATQSVVKSLLLHIRFDGKSICLTSGVNYHTFSMDKSAERAWDEALSGFVRKLFS